MISNEFYESLSRPRISSSISQSSEPSITKENREYNSAKPVSVSDDQKIVDDLIQLDTEILPGSPMADPDDIIFEDFARLRMRSTDV